MPKPQSYRRRLDVARDAVDAARVSLRLTPGADGARDLDAALLDVNRAMKALGLVKSWILEKSV